MQSVLGLSCHMFARKHAVDKHYFATKHKTQCLPSLISIKTSGTAGGIITYKNLQGHSPKIEYDGSFGIKLNANVNYILIEGIEIEGPVGSVSIFCMRHDAMCVYACVERIRMNIV